MKKHFITGLVILLPLTLTFFFVAFVFNLLTNPFVGLVQSIFHYFKLFESGFWIFTPEQIQEYASKICTVIFLISFTVLLGAVARWYFFHYLLSIWNYILHRIPFVNVVYKTCQDVIDTIFSSKTRSFKQVVLVPFPHPDSRSIGFVTADDLPNLLPGSERTVTVFIPTTPNPTSGFLVFFSEKDLNYLDMKVEDAFKYIISCGVLPTTLNVISKTEAADLNKE